MATNNRLLDGKVALITAGAAAISVASAKLLVRDGAIVVLMGRRLTALKEVRDSILENYPDAKISIFSGDSCKEHDVISIMQNIREQHGRLDIIVSVVGGGGFKPLLLLNSDELVADFKLNVISAFLAVKYGLPLMSSGGSVVCISSIAAKLSFPYLCSYNTSKAGLEGFVRAAADELGPRGVRVNAVRPGFTRSAGTASMFENPTVIAKTVEQCTLGRVGEPEDIAPAIRFLAGPESSWMTGQSFAVDGGNELRRNPDLTDMVTQMFGADAVVRSLEKN